MRATRSLALALAAVALAVAGCGAAEELVDDLPGVSVAPSDGEQPSGAPTEPGSTEGGQDATPGPTEPGQQPTGQPGATEGTEAPPGATPLNDAGGVGANGRAMLRGDRTRLVVEIDVQDGVTVDQAAVDHLVDEVARHVDKSQGIVFVGSNTFASDRTEWTAADLREVAATNRTTSSTADEVSVHVLYVRGGFYQDGEETAAIGVAYSASNIAVFPERWAGLGTLLGSSRAIERAVLVHEFGHLFGLVNLTYDSDIDHEDPDHPGHSSSQRSVMFHAIESTLIGQVFSGPPPDRFDDADAADLAGLRSGRY